MVYGRDGAVDRPPGSRTSDPGGAWGGVLFLSPNESPQRSKLRGAVRNVLLRNLSLVAGPFLYSIVPGFGKSHLVENFTTENLRYLSRGIENPQKGKFSIDNAPAFA